MTTQPKLLLIRGLGHSGTTLLDLALGAHSQVQGFGEAMRLLRRPAPGEEQGGPARLRRELRHERLCTFRLGLWEPKGGIPKKQTMTGQQRPN